MWDYHMHSDFSGDSQTPAEEQVLAARRAGLSEICFTEHLDIDHPSPEYEGQIDFPAYFKELDRLRALYPDIKILTGIEAGDQAGQTEPTMEVVAAHPFDFVLLSLHVIDGLDPYDREFYRGKTQSGAYRLYALRVVESLERCDDFDSMSHFGYVAKFAPYDREVRPFRRSHAPDLVDEALSILVKKDKALEINTSGIPAYGVCIPDIDIVTRFRQLGGACVTLGSDAHQPRRVGENIIQAARVAQAAGIKYIARYRGRKRQCVTVDAFLSEHSQKG